jgi:hypothetical protein
LPHSLVTKAVDLADSVGDPFFTITFYPGSATLKSKPAKKSNHPGMLLD